MEENKYLIFLAHLYDIEASNMDYLLRSFGGAQNIYEAKISDIENIKGIPKSISERIASLKKKINLDELLNYMGANHIQFISKFDKEYPYLLKQIDNPPLGLFYIGEIPSENLLWVSSIGARKCTEYGKNVAYSLCKDLAKKQVVIVSGLAEGLDAMSHKGAIDGGGKTVAVLGSGVDICYPYSNKELYYKIMQNGCVMSEFPPRQGTMPWHFPKRNRIISGLSYAIIVIEAGIKSGTMITVDCALSQGRQVMAVPGNITSKFSMGTNQLIKEGCNMVTCAEDIFDGLGIFEDIEEKLMEENIVLAPTDKSVYDCIGETPKGLDDIILYTGLDIQTIQFVLTNLELKGKIRKLPGQRYMKI